MLSPFVRSTGIVDYKMTDEDLMKTALEILEQVGKILCHFCRYMNIINVLAWCGHR